MDERGMYIMCVCTAYFSKIKKSTQAVLNYSFYYELTFLLHHFSKMLHINKDIIIHTYESDSVLGRRQTLKKISQLKSVK